VAIHLKKKQTTGVKSLKKDWVTIPNSI